MQDVLRANLAPADLGRADLFEEEDPWATHEELLTQLLRLQCGMGKPVVRQELAVLMAFHGKVCDKRWLAQRAMVLRKMLSRVIRTARQMKTGERLTEAMSRLTSAVRGTAHGGEWTGKMKRLLRRRSSASEDPPPPKKNRNRNPEGDPEKIRSSILRCYRKREDDLSPQVVSSSDSSSEIAIVLAAGKTYWDSSKGKVVHCLEADGTLLEATSMQHGEDGFLVCDFGEFEQIRTEVPNLKLHMMKKPAMGDAADDGDTVEVDPEEEEKDEEEEEEDEEGEGEEEDEEAEEDEEGEEDDEEVEEVEEGDVEEQEEAEGEKEKKDRRAHKNKPSKPKAKAASDSKYSVMYYKRDNVCALRRKFGGKEQCISFGGKSNRLSEKSLRELAAEAVAKLDKGRSEEEVHAWVRAQACKRGVRR